MRYSYKCEEHGAFIREFAIRDGPEKFVACPLCGTISFRDFRSDLPPKPHYNCQGFHGTDYDDQGDKVERLNRTWSKHLGGIKPPPPASSVPRNSSEPY